MQTSASPIQAKKLKGFHDFLPKECLTRHNIISRIREQALFCGFEQIDTPALEYAETLLGSSGEESDKETYHFKDHGEREVALRFDLTVPFARFVSENFHELIMPFKRLQIGEVWRGEKPQKGRYRQFCQADLDIVGVDSVAADVEVLSALQMILHAVVPSPHTLHLSNRKLLSAVIRKLAPTMHAENETKVLIVLDKLAKLERMKIEELLAPLLPNAAAVSQLIDILTAKDKAGDSDLEKLRAFLGSTHECLPEVERFINTAEILRHLAKKSNLASKLVLDLSIARGLGYYTGIVYETTIDGLQGFGSISSGGRYNNLLSRFGKHDLAGVGGSIGVDRLVAALQELGTDTLEGKREVFIAVAEEEFMGYGFELLGQLRQHKIVSDITMRATKLGNQFKYADKKNFAYVVVIGSEEFSSKTITFKELKTGNEEKLKSREHFLSLVVGKKPSVGNP